MKIILIALVMIFIVGCSQRSTSSVGTLVSVSNIDGKACDFGTITLQPAVIGGELIKFEISDMTKNKKSELSKFIGKKVMISIIEKGRIGCQTSSIEVEEFNAQN